MTWNNQLVPDNGGMQEALTALLFFIISCGDWGVPEMTGVPRKMSKRQ